MARYKNLPLPTKVEQLELEESDYRKISRPGLLNMLEDIFLINSFENAVLDLKENDLVHGPVHSAVGQEAVAAGIGLGLNKTDLIASTHRAHHHYLGKVLSYYRPPGYNTLTDDLSSDMQTSITVLLAEVMGLSPGCCGGRGGSMHLRERRAGVIGTNAIVGGGIAMATGAAWATRLKGSDNIVVSILGDGACNQGVFLEAANMAALWKCPIIYFVENNLYAVATSSSQSTRLDHLAWRTVGLSVPAIIVDGMDPVAVYIAVKAAREKMRAEKTPVLIEAKTYRLYHHAGKSPGSSFGYRSKAEEKEWKKKDPLTTYPAKLKAMGVCSGDDIRKIEGKAEAAVAKALTFCTVSEGSRRKIKVKLWPEKESVTVGVRSAGDEFNDISFSRYEDFGKFKKTTYVEAISTTIARRMEVDDKIVVIGEEVANFGGGAYQATKGIPEKYPGRIFNTPISEAGFVGVALGLALEGFKPIVELMFPDFALVAGDQLFNQMGKLRHIYGGKVDIPVVVRTRIAIGDGYGAQHSFDPSGLFALFPGWRIAAPATAFDYVGLMNSALRSRDPVLIIEHRELYNEEGQIPANNYDYFIELGKARIRRTGHNVIVVTYLNGVRKVLQTTQELSEKGVETEVIDLRTLDYASVDYATIGASLKKTGKLVIVEEAPRSAGIGSRIADEIQRRFFDYLDAPIKIVASKDVPNPVSKVLESHAVLNTQDIIKALLES